MEIIVVGLNHKTAPLHAREKLDFTQNLDNALLALKELPNINESVILSTCNRVEIYIAVRNLNSKNTVEEIKKFLSMFHKVEIDFLINTCIRIQEMMR